MSATSSSEALPPPVKMAKRKVHYNSGGPWTHHRTRALRKLLGRGDELFAERPGPFHFRAVHKSTKLGPIQAVMICLPHNSAGIPCSEINWPVTGTAQHSIPLCALLNWWALLCLVCSVLSRRNVWPVRNSCSFSKNIHLTLFLSFSCSPSLRSFFEKRFLFVLNLH